VKKFILLFLIASFVYGQNSVLKISPIADSLAKLVKLQPRNVQFRIQLIDEYLKKSQPELALLEIQQFYHNNLQSEKIREKLIQVLFWLGKKKLVYPKLVEQYLLKPGDKKNFYLAVDDWALGNKERAIRFLNSLKLQVSDLSIQLALLYQKLYFLNRKELAKASSELLENFSFSEYSRLFPNPTLFIYSPNNNYFTTAGKITVNFLVKHTKPIKIVKVNNKLIFNLTDAKPAKKKFNKNFKTQINLRPGKNLIKIYAQDIFGYSISKVVKVFAATFDLLPVEKFYLKDSIKYLTDLLNGFVGKNFFSKKSSLNKALLISYPATQKTNTYSPYIWRTLLINSFTGKFENSKIQPLINDYATKENIDPIIKNWLLANLNIKTNTFLFLKGNWFNSNNKWLMKLKNGNFNIVDFINKFNKLASNSLTILIEGNFNDSLFNYIAKNLKKCNIPNKLIFIDNNKFSYEKFINQLFVPIDSVNYSNSNDYFEYYSRQDSTLKYNKINSDVTNILEFPAAKIKNFHAELYMELADNLKKIKRKTADKKKILEFCKNWKRINEISDYLNNKITYVDILTYAREYFSRTSSKQGE